MTYQDILCEITEGVATLVINRPEVYNAFRPLTCEELIDAFYRAGADSSIGVIVLTGAGEKAFARGAINRLMMASTMVWAGWDCRSSNCRRRFAMSPNP